MIDGCQRGPFELAELAAAGVRPGTYVWCKGMADWKKAEDVADICRYFRQRLAGLGTGHLGTGHLGTGRRAPGTGSGRDQSPSRSGGENLRFSPWVPSPEPGNRHPEPTPDTSVAPAPTLFLALFLTLFCFPITGLVAVYYSYKARRAWAESQRSESKTQKELYTNAEREQLRLEAHDCGRQAKMWIGITFFLGVIFYAFLGHRFG